MFCSFIDCQSLFDKFTTMSFLFTIWPPQCAIHSLIITKPFHFLFEHYWRTNNYSLFLWKFNIILFSGTLSKESRNLSNGKKSFASLSTYETRHVTSLRNGTQISHSWWPRFLFQKYDHCFSCKVDDQIFVCI